MMDTLLVVAFVGILGIIVCTLILRIYRPTLKKYNNFKHMIVFETLGLIAIWSILILVTRYA